ncbi:MAG: DUF2834 domain-containing protein [Gammaproteobacteria bacterium]|nr:DUF2834 domain-containing protein [Gammaproteobacteria bacterium]
MRKLYLLLAIAGAIVPLYFFAQFFFIDEQAVAMGFIPALFVNGATAGFTADLLISSFVFWIYMWSRRAQGPNPLPFVIVNLCIGLSCALPAYLYVAAEKSRPAGN